MPPEKVPINAKIPPRLHSLILEAVKRKDYIDKTDCITQALDKLLNNTHQSNEDNTSVLQERENNTTTLQAKLQNNLKKIAELQDRITELQRIIDGIPDPQEIATIKARDSVIQEILDEKDKRMEALENNLRDIRVIIYKQVTQESNTVVLSSNTQAGGLIKKNCKFCGNTFDTGNIKQETCSQKCRSAFFRKNKKNGIQ